MAQARIGFVGYCPPSIYSEEEASKHISEAFDKIEAEFRDQEIVLVSGLSNVGTLSLAYHEATRRGWVTGAVTSEKVMADYANNLYPIDEEAIIVGKDWGAESPVFVYGIGAIAGVDPNKVSEYEGHPHYGLDAMVRVGGGEQSMREVEMVRKMEKPIYEFDLPRLG